MSLSLDLKQLAHDRRTPASPPVRRRSPIVTRYLIPAAVLFGFVTLLAYGTREQWLPAKTVTVVPVVVARTETAASAGTPLFQAAGWVEPRPGPVLVSALTEGIVAELLVVDGQTVEANAPVAQLIDADAKLALRQAQADLRLRQADLAAAESDAVAAKQRFDMPLHLQIELAEAESRLATSEGQLESHPSRLAAAEAKLRLAEATRTAREAGGDAIARRLLRDVEAEVSGAEAEIAGLRASEPRLKQEAEALRQKTALLRDQRKRLTEEARRVSEANSAVEAAHARVQQSELAVEVAQLSLERTLVRAPIAGRVLKVLATRGSRVGGRSLSGVEGTNVCSLYDPKALQVRADVRLEDVPRIALGAPARIETASAGQPIVGQVLLATGEANVQKNTLAVKVALVDPPEAIRPEMLVQVTFLAPKPSAAESAGSQPPERMLIPPSLVEGTGVEATVWLADVEGRARRRSITLGQPAPNGLVEVASGLRPTDKLIAAGRESLTEGDRLIIAGEADAP